MSSPGQGLKAPQGIKVLFADNTPEGVIVTFSDGLTALYQPHFLYEMRENDHNMPLLLLDLDAVRKQDFGSD